MIKEVYQIKINETTLNVVRTKIDSIRKKDITKSGCRVYEKCPDMQDYGYIGVAGTFGEVLEDTWERAIKNLELKIPYCYDVSKNAKRKRDLRQLNLSHEQFLEKSEKLFELFRKEFPDFVFSNKIKLVETETSLKNDVGLDYVNCDKTISMELIIKHVDSVNVFDSTLIFQSREFNIDKILDETKQQLNAFNNEVELPDLKKAAVIISEDAWAKIYESLNGEALGRGVSMFNGKVDKKIFSDKLTIYGDLSGETYHVPFFDAEGSVLENDTCSLIENGVILRGYTDKKNSKEFGVKNTASASADYDDVPMLDMMNMSIKKSDKTFIELVGDEPVIFASVISGGDCTNDGDFATPVQMAYLMQNGKYMGKLPEFSINGNIYDMFGNDYIGLSKDKFAFNQNLLVCRMNINK